MDSRHTFSIDTILRRLKNDKTKGCVYLRITIDGQQAEISSKEIVPFTEWNSVSEKVTGRSLSVKATNDHLEYIRFKIREHYRRLTQSNVETTAQSVKEAYFGMQLKPKGHTLVELIEFPGGKIQRQGPVFVRPQLRILSGV